MPACREISVIKLVDPLACALHVIKASNRESLLHHFLDALGIAIVLDAKFKDYGNLQDVLGRHPGGKEVKIMVNTLEESRE